MPVALLALIGTAWLWHFFDDDTVRQRKRLPMAAEGVNGLASVAGGIPLLPGFLGSDTPEMRSKFLATIPLGRFAKPSDVAAAALLLSSAEAVFLTGVVLEVDGGRTI
jgi:3-oxoacyl-[acyl-carrier protein] reductase